MILMAFGSGSLFIKAQNDETALRDITFEKQNLSHIMLLLYLCTWQE